MKLWRLTTLWVLLATGCASYQGGTRDVPETSRGSIREQGTTGLGVGSDTTTQTGIDSGTRSGSGLPAR
jgi:hypothetical protein